MAIIKRKNGTYQIRLKKNGRIQAWSAGRSITYARKLQEKKKTEIRENKDFDKERKCTLLFRDLAKRYMEHYEDVKKSIKRDDQSLKHLLPFFGSKLAMEITPSMVEIYQRKRKAEKSRLGNLTAIATLNLELNCMSAIYTFATKKERLLTYNPIHYITKEKPNNRRQREISDDEFNRLLEVAPDYFKAVLLTAWNTAMRKGEILNLTWNKVDMQVGIIHLLAEDTKEKKEKIIPLNDVLCRLFNQLYNQKILDTSRVFLRDGKPVKNIRSVFSCCCDKVGVENFRFHDIRGCVISRWRREGKEPFTIMRITGHRTLEVFEGYNRFNIADLRAVVNSQVVPKVVTPLSESVRPIP